MCSETVCCDVNRDNTADNKSDNRSHNGWTGENHTDDSRKCRFHNHMVLRFDAISVNEAFARMAVAAFMMELDPTIEEMDDVKTAVSEAVTNSIIHGYPFEGEQSNYDKDAGNEREISKECGCRDQNRNGWLQVEMECTYQGRCLTVKVRDWGVGISDIAKAREPFYTSKPELERSGMGFAFMEAFMDEVKVESEPGEGTCVTMVKHIGDEVSISGEVADISAVAGQKLTTMCETYDVKSRRSEDV